MKKAFLSAKRQNKKTFQIQAFWYNQFLVIWSMTPPYQQQAGFLTQSSTSAAAFPKHSLQ